MTDIKTRERKRGNKFGIADSGKSLHERNSNNEEKKKKKGRLGRLE